MASGRKCPLTAAALLVCAASFGASFVCADGPPRNRARQVESGTDYTPTALDAYGSGYAFIERAARFNQDAAAAPDTRSRDAALAGARVAYEDALRAFEQAARLDARMYEAHTYIGYARRKLGQYDRALEAYAAALELKPDYVRAIEYQGEAFLGLDRFEQAKFNYQRLYALDGEQASKLLAAMRRWADMRAREPGSVSLEVIAAAEKWLKAQPHTDVGQVASGETPW